MSVTARDLVTSLIGLWIVIGVYIDGWAHVNRVGVEDFFTPWHAIFYSGLAVFFAWIGLLALRAGGLRRLPGGYLAGAVGAAIFATGGAVDMLWHELLGVETSIDALLSPPHLVLLTGVLLMGSSGWRSQRGLSPTTTLPELVSLTSVVMISGFFLNFLSPFRVAAPTFPFQPYRAEHLVVMWIGGVLVSTALFLIPVLWQLRDRRYRAGTLSVFVAATGVAVALAMTEPGMSKPLNLAGVAGALAGAVAAEFVIARVPWRSWRYGLPATMAVSAFTVWGGQLIGLGIGDAIRWPATLWLGSLLFALGAGAAVAAVAWRPSEVRP